jgi:AAA15 family ATPase/GTPase
MLLRFGVENHGSIADYQELHLVASALKDGPACLMPAADPRVNDGKPIRVLPVAGIYGANASGKSTLLRSFKFFVDVIAQSHASIANRTGTPFFPFALDQSSGARPSRYDADVVLNGIRYHYGFTLDGKHICQEWLYCFDLGAARQVKSVMFARQTADDGSVEISFPGKSLKGQVKQIAKLVRANSLFMSVAAQNAHPQISPLFDFFDGVVRRLDANMSQWVLMDQLMAYFGGDPQRTELAVEFLKAADIGISGLEFSKVPLEASEIKLIKDFERVLREHAQSTEAPMAHVANGLDLNDRPQVKVLHHGRDGMQYPIHLRSESAGTRSLLQLLGPVLVKLQQGGLVIVDELNTTLHPLVCRELIRLFQNPATNPGRAQLIFTTHDTNLLTGSLLRRDQIWFTEKDNQGATHVYALSDIKVRATDNLERGYLMGRFGAVPFVGCGLDEFASLLGQKPEQGYQE